MPYRWTESPETDEAVPVARLVLWPHQSMTERGFVTFIGLTALMLALPLLAVLGTPVTWVLMVFFLAALAGVWFAIMKNREHQSLHEELRLWPDRLHLRHVRPSKAPLEWEANPYWVTLNLRDRGPVEKYLTIKGNDREVELGAFLSPDEREALHEELQMRLSALR